MVPGPARFALVSGVVVTVGCGPGVRVPPGPRAEYTTLVAADKAAVLRLAKRWEEDGTGWQRVGSPYQTDNYTTWTQTLRRYP